MVCRRGGGGGGGGSFVSNIVYKNDSQLTANEGKVHEYIKERYKGIR